MVLLSAEQLPHLLDIILDQALLLLHDFFLNVAHFNAMVGQISKFLIRRWTRNCKLTIFFCFLVGVLLRLASYMQQLLIARLCEEGRVVPAVVLLMMSVIIDNTAELLI